MVYYAIAFLIVALDQFTKWLVVKYMELGESITIIPDIFYLTSHRNRGAAWGMLEGRMWFFYIITIVFIVGIVYYIKQYGKTEKLFGISLGVLLGGAIGNFIDRVLHQEVIDFFHMYIGSYSFPIFNVADVALTVGVILVLVYTILDEVKQRRSK